MFVDNLVLKVFQNFLINGPVLGNSFNKWSGPGEGFNDDRLMNGPVLGMSKPD